MVQGKYKFQKLTPTSNVDITVYREAIDFAFDNADIKNVAISGAYSAGKSSLIESYKAIHKEKKFLHLSLAHFVPADGGSETGEEGSNQPIKEAALEGKILNQLLHQIPADSIPQTNFRVKREVRKRKVWEATAFVVTFIISLLRLMQAERMRNFALNLQEGWIQKVVIWAAQPYGTILAALVCLL